MGVCAVLLTTRSSAVIPPHFMTRPIVCVVATVMGVMGVCCTAYNQERCCDTFAIHDQALRIICVLKVKGVHKWLHASTRDHTPGGTPSCDRVMLWKVMLSKVKLSKVLLCKVLRFGLGSNTSQAAHLMVTKFLSDLDILRPSISRCPECRK